MDEKIKEVLVDFVKWIKVKVKVHLKDNTLLSYKEREIWWANFGLNVGSEQNGKNEDFERPVLVLRKFGHSLFWAVPLTSKPEERPYKLAFDYKDYFINITGDLIITDKNGFLVLNQMRALSSKRLIRKLGVVEEENFNMIKDKIKCIL
jgi:mRNA-degrading endonuclease toxin of MazEF toxin-antitoxin module